MRPLAAAAGFVCLIWAGTNLLAQTTLDLSTQTKNIDFSGAVSTRPSKTGTTLPASCSSGQTFFKTDAAPGSNWYGCTSQNTWTVQGGAGGTGASTISQLLDFGLTRTTPQQLTIGAACSLISPCHVRSGATVRPFTSSVITLTGGTGTAWIYLDQTGTMTVGHNLSLSCDSGCQQIPGVTSFPAESIPLFSWTATAGTWDNSGNDYRAVFAQKVVTAGPGIIISDSANASQISIDTAALLTSSGNNSFTGINSFANAMETAPAKTGTTLPGACTLGDLFFQTSAAPGQNLFFCTSSNIWTQMSGGGGGGSGQVTLAGSNSFTGVNSFTHAIETAPAQVGSSLPASCTLGDFYFLTTATAGQNLFFCTASNTWTQMSGGGGGGSGQATLAGSNSFTGINSFAHAIETAPAQVGSSLPASCTLGDFYFLTTATAGQNIYICTAANTWTQMSAGASAGGSTSTTTAYADLVDSSSAAGSSRQSIKTFTLASGTWATNNQFARIHAWGVAAAAGSYISVLFGSTAIASPPGANFANLPIDISCTIGRTGSALEKSVCVVIFGQNVATYNTQMSPAEDLTAAVAITVAGINGNGNAGDVVIHGFTVEPGNY